MGKKKAQEIMPVKTVTSPGVDLGVVRVVRSNPLN